MVKKTVSCVNVISKSKSLFNEIRPVLIRLGCPSISFCQWRDFLETDISRPGMIHICCLENNLSRRKKDRIAYKIKNRPVLGVIRNHDGSMNTEWGVMFDEILFWPCSEDELGFRFERLRRNCPDADRPKKEEEFSDSFLKLNIVGKSPPFLHALEKIKKFARCDAPVLIEGETGTGKELAARAIFYMSDRREYPFIPVNCGAIPHELLENEFFGHKKGAYTDAKTDSRGLVAQAGHGAIFLDEIEAFSPKGQVVLLRFLQDQKFKPLGSEKVDKANIRVIAASNKNLFKMANEGQFRHDLLYRLNILFLKLPTLAERKGDIRLLAEHFLNKFRQQYNQPDKYMHPDLLEWMDNYSWPGNIRELENMVHRWFVLSDGQNIISDRADQAGQLENIFNINSKFLLKYSFNDAKKTIIDLFEKKYLCQLIKESGGNVTRAAKRAEKERRAFGKLLKKHGISKDGRITP